LATLRDIFVRLGVKTDPQGFKGVESGIKRVTDAAKVAVTALAGLKIVGVFKGYAEETRALGDRLDKVSQQMGVTTDALQELEFAGGLAGASSDEVSTALRMLARNSYEASTGAKEYLENFEAMGIAVRDGSGQLKSADRLLMEVADGMTTLSTDTERTALAQTLLGRSGAKLIPLLKQGSAAIAEQRQEARDLGLMDKQEIGLAVELTDNQLRLETAYRQIKLAVGKGLMPAMNAATAGMANFLKENRALIRQNITRFFKGAARVIRSVGSLFGGLIDAGRRWAASLGDVSQVFLRIAAIAAALAVVLMLPAGSILLLIALVALIIDDFQTWRDGGDSLIGDLVAGFKGLAFELGLFVDALGESIDEFWSWAKDHQTGITLVTSLVAGLAIVIGVKLVAANAAATASTLSYKLFAVRYYLTTAASAVASAAASAAAWVASAAASAAAWLAATLPLILTAALLAVIVGTLIWLGAELVKLATGQENFFTTMADGITGLVEEWGGLGEAIGAMLDEALRYWLGFFGNTDEEIQTWIDNATDTLMSFWDNILEHWSDVVGRWWDKWSNVVDFGFGGDDEEETDRRAQKLFELSEARRRARENGTLPPAAAPPGRPPAGAAGEAGAPGLPGAAGEAGAGLMEGAPSILAGPSVSTVTNAGRTSNTSVVDNSSQNFNVTVTAGGQIDERRLADEVVSRAREMMATERRQAMQSVVLEAP